MRTNEERIEAMHRRAAQLAEAERAKRAVRARLIGAGAGAVSFAAVILLAVMMPDLSDNAAPAGAGSGMSGSIFAANGYLGYVVIGIVAFLLGAAVTVFCIRLKDYSDSGGAMKDDQTPGGGRQTGRDDDA
jgi:hypothetical protein